MDRSWLAVVGLCGGILAGCTTISAVTLKHPVTGQVAKCGPYESNPFIGLGVAMERERACVRDFQRAGFERVPD